ncbi:MAG: methyltransferase domain-containing protein [Planctomycetes bacterium]|nr:methyltransferase domain-containing protein [Planctomycetota bacterium]
MRPATERDDLLRHLAGRGIEIGALDSPVPVPPGAAVRYVDVLTRAECLRHYPELPDPAAVVEPDIVASADDLGVFPDRSEDFLIACHLLEHMPDPIGTLKGWHRVLRPGGLVFLVVPDKRRTFDRPRPRTPLRHLVADHREPPGTPARDRRDFAAYREWVRLSKALRTEAQIDFWAELLQRARYSIHFHCWIPEDVRELIEHLARAEATPFKIVREGRFRDGWEFAFLLRREEAPAAPPAAGRPEAAPQGGAA